MKSDPKIRILPILLLLLLPSQTAATNVVFFVADGTGPVQLAAARIAVGGPDGRLALDRMEQIAVVTIHSASGLTTDSAAGATAWSTGRKTNNGFLAVTPDSAKLKTVLEYARDAGLGTGLVTSTSLTHATPAAFASHIEDRGAQNRIAAQMLAARPDLMLGGGRAFWIPQARDGSKREDDRDLMAEANRAGYRVVETGDQFRQLDPENDRRVLGLFAPGHLTYAYDLTDDSEPTLADMTTFALDVLEKSEKGFLLVVEGGRIDHACHSNDADRAVWEAISFDRAIGRALAFAERYPDTLVLFTADHETGGMTIGNAAYEGFPDIPRADGFPARSVVLGEALKIGWTTGGHTGVPILAAAAGPGAEKIRGLLDNTDLFPILMEALDLEAD